MLNGGITIIEKFPEVWIVRSTAQILHIFQHLLRNTG
jgi:hypothetical protein